MTPTLSKPKTIPHRALNATLRNRGMERHSDPEICQHVAGRSANQRDLRMCAAHRTVRSEWWSGRNLQPGVSFQKSKGVGPAAHHDPPLAAASRGRKTAGLALAGVDREIFRIHHGGIPDVRAVARYGI